MTAPKRKCCELAEKDLMTERIEQLMGLMTAFRGVPLEAMIAMPASRKPVKRAAGDPK